MYVVDPSTVRRVDAATIDSGVPGYELMQIAGRGAARIVLGDDPDPTGTTIVVCGKGNNGGDGFVVARELHLAHRHVVVAMLDHEPNGDAARAHADAIDCGVRVERLGSDPGAALRDLDRAEPGSHVVDAVFGTGVRLPLKGPAADLVGAIEPLGRRVVALDGPSGLDGATGELDVQAPRAARTVSFGLMKWGMVLEPGRAACGRLDLIDLEFDPELVERARPSGDVHALWVDAKRAAAWWPSRSLDAHKYAVGSVFAVGGARGMSGAIAMACNACLRAGAGLVEATVPRSVAEVVDGHCIETLVHAAAETDAGCLSRDLLPGLLDRARRHRAALVGPGAGTDPETAHLMLDLIDALEIPVVVDADGLNAPERAGRRPRFPEGSIVTPHTGELSRLVGIPTARVAGNRLTVLREAAFELGTTILHKGGPTFVAAPDGRLAVIGAGGPELATAGTGDVLTGTVAALLANGLPAFESAALGAFLHGRAGRIAAERHGVAGVMARDVHEALGGAIREVEREAAR